MRKFLEYRFSEDIIISSDGKLIEIPRSYYWDKLNPISSRCLEKVYAKLLWHRQKWFLSSVVDILMGLASGYNMCCIIYFIRYHHKNWKRSMLTGDFDKLYKYLDLLKKTNSCYILCPKCLYKKISTMKTTQPLRDSEMLLSNWVRK